MRRFAGFLFGAATQIFFLLTVWFLWQFLAGHEPRVTSGSEWTNAALALQFAVPHSLLLHPATRKRLSRWIAGPFYGCFFCVVTCVSLFVMFACWHGSDVVIVRCEGALAMVVRGLWMASWLALFYSLWLTGLGYQTGLTPWWDWVLRRPPRRRNFSPRGAYRLLRHPVYLSFLGLVWFTPTVTLDRLTLIAVWTPYIFLGSWLKDRRLEHYLGESYRQYMASVAGYPGFFFGPLARVVVPITEEEAPVILPMTRTPDDRLRNSGSLHRKSA